MAVPCAQPQSESKLSAVDRQIQSLVEVADVLGRELRHNAERIMGAQLEPAPKCGALGGPEGPPTHALAGIDMALSQLHSLLESAQTQARRFDAL